MSPQTAPTDTLHFQVKGRANRLMTADGDELDVVGLNVSKPANALQ